MQMLFLEAQTAWHHTIQENLQQTNPKNLYILVAQKSRQFTEK